MATSPQPDGESGTVFSAETYFATQPPPPSLESDVARVKEFVLRQLKEGRNVVLVTVCLSYARLYAIWADISRRVVVRPFRSNSTCEHLSDSRCALARNGPDS